MNKFGEIYEIICDLLAVGAVIAFIWWMISHGGIY